MTKCAKHDILYKLSAAPKFIWSSIEVVITSTTGNRVAVNAARGFESLLLRQKSTVILSELQWIFSVPENRLKSGFSAVPSYNEPRRRAFLRRGSCVLSGLLLSVSLPSIVFFALIADTATPSSKTHPLPGRSAGVQSRYDRCRALRSDSSLHPSA